MLAQHRAAPGAMYGRRRYPQPPRVGCGRAGSRPGGALTLSPGSRSARAGKAGGGVRLPAPSGRGTGRRPGCPGKGRGGCPCPCRAAGLFHPLPSKRFREPRRGARGRSPKPLPSPGGAGSRRPRRAVPPPPRDAHPGQGWDAEGWVPQPRSAARMGLRGVSSARGETGAVEGRQPLPGDGETAGGVCASPRRNVRIREDTGSALPINSRSMWKMRCHLS